MLDFDCITPAELHSLFLWYRPFSIHYTPALVTQGSRVTAWVSFLFVQIWSHTWYCMAWIWKNHGTGQLHLLFCKLSEQDYISSGFSCSVFIWHGVLHALASSSSLSSSLSSSSSAAAATAAAATRYHRPHRKRLDGVHKTFPFCLTHFLRFFWLLPPTNRDLGSSSWSQLADLVFYHLLGGLISLCNSSLRLHGWMDRWMASWRVHIARPVVKRIHGRLFVWFLGGKLTTLWWRQAGKVLCGWPWAWLMRWLWLHLAFAYSVEQDDSFDKLKWNTTNFSSRSCWAMDYCLHLVLLNIYRDKLVRRFSR